jgi:hypothetical protein
MSDFQQNGSSVQFKPMGRLCSKSNIAHAKGKDESAPEAVPLVLNIEKIRPKWVGPVPSSANATGTTSCTFPSLQS